MNQSTEQPSENSICQKALQLAGKSYPRTCALCGLGPCHYPDSATEPSPAPADVPGVDLERPNGRTPCEWLDKYLDTDNRWLLEGYHNNQVVHRVLKHCAHLGKSVPVMYQFLAQNLLIAYKEWFERGMRLAESQPITQQSATAQSELARARSELTTTQAALTLRDAEVVELHSALADASDHLDYCGYGDSWERQGTEELRRKITKALAIVPPTTNRKEPA